MQGKLRADCVAWLLCPEQLPYCLKDCGTLVKHKTVTLDNGKKVTRPCSPLARDDTAINEARFRDLSACDCLDVAGLEHLHLHA